MCGATIPQGENICGNCGGIFSEDDSGTDRIIANPDWGRISIDLESIRGDITDLFAKIKDCWLELELRSAQRLFSGQLVNREVLVSDIDLYGPRESFARLADVLKVAGEEPSIIEFHSLPYDEIYKLRDIEGKADGAVT